MLDTKTVLLVEDNDADAELAIIAFHRNGLRNPITRLASGLAALDALFPADPAALALPLVLMLDLRLPLIDGMDVLRRVRADLRTKALPVIVFTGAVSDADAMQCYTLRADFVLAKPFDFWDWHQVMRRLDLLGQLEWEPAAAGKAPLSRASLARRAQLRM